jgi:glyoxylase-like metal-dependent hydrolase (beta-lactamase superfamily II)
VDVPALACWNPAKQLNQKAGIRMDGTRALLVVAFSAAAVWIGVASMLAPDASAAPAPPKTLRLYVLDCGLINVNRAGVERYNVTPEEVGETRFVVPCFLIAHPRGTLMWDLGIVPDDTVEARARGEQGNPTATTEAVAPVKRTLASQLAEIGYKPADITYFAISHAHGDHVANANLFAASTWLARPAERAFMWEEGNTRVNRTYFDRIEKSHTISLDQDEYDVFGDGAVVIKSAPGHSPGHQVLVLRLASTGRVMLAGDLYHYPQERTLHRQPPATEFSVEQSAASRTMIEDYLARTKTAIWIEHDFTANAKLKKAPAYYE